MLYELRIGAARHAVEISNGDAGRLRVQVGGESYEIEVMAPGPPVLLAVDGKLFELGVQGELITWDGHEARLLPRTSGASAVSAARTLSGMVTLQSPMPGRVVRVLCNTGDRVKAGQGLLVLEAMKMENELSSPADATVTEVCVGTGAAIEAGALLLRLALGTESE